MLKRLPVSPLSILPLLAMVLALSLAMLLPVTPARAGDWLGWIGIHGEDDRDDVRFNGGWPWVAIGRVDVQGGGHCSGTLIGRSKVLTAAHCLTDGRGGFVDPSSLTFSAGLDRGRARASSGIRDFVVDRDFRFGRDGRPEELALDWAILELERQLYDGGWLRPVGLASRETAIRAVAEGWELAQAGYSGDRSEQLSRNQRCVTEGIAGEGRVILHRCDATFGDSGSPVLIYRDGNFEIAAVHVAVVSLADGSRVGAAVVPDYGGWW